MNGLEKVIFINYPVGCFGSFLSACLRLSDSIHPIFKLYNTDIFDETGAAHKQIVEPIKYFHQPHVLLDWINKSNEDKNAFFKKNLDFPNDFMGSNLYYVHRLTLPVHNKTFTNFFNTSKFIKITIDDTELDLMSDFYYKKIIYNRPAYVHNKPLAKSMAIKYLKKHRNNDIEEGVYNFNVKWFIDGTFIEEFNKLTEWLKFEKINVNEIYNKFKQVNNLEKK